MKAEIKITNNKAAELFLASAKIMAEEHSGYYAESPYVEAGMFIDGKSVGTRPCDEQGWDYEFDFVASVLSGLQNCTTVSWITSAGNMLTVHKDGSILAEGRRHGIPFWVLPDGWVEDVEYYRYESTERPDLAPWEKSSGRYCQMTVEKAFTVLSASEADDGYEWPRYARKLTSSISGIDIERFPYVGVAGSTPDGEIGIYFGDKVSVNTYCQNRKG
jgi:hypothetical protein